MNMSDDHANEQFEEQVNELLANTLEQEESIEDLFEQRTTKQAHKSNVNHHNNVLV